MTEVEQFLHKSPLYRCERLGASITKRQCDANKSTGRIFACEGCGGLGESVKIDLGEDVVEKICDMPGCHTKVHSRGKCWKHVKSALGIDPQTGHPLEAKHQAAKPIAAVKEAKVTGMIRVADPLPDATPMDSAMAREIDALFAAKRAEWLFDLQGATSERSRAKMFLAMTDSLEGMAY